MSEADSEQEVYDAVRDGEISEAYEVDGGVMDDSIEVTAA